MATELKYNSAGDKPIKGAERQFVFYEEITRRVNMHTMKSWITSSVATSHWGYERLKDSYERLKLLKQCDCGYSELRCYDCPQLRCCSYGTEFESNVERRLRFERETNNSDDSIRELRTLDPESVARLLGFGL